MEPLDLENFFGIDAKAQFELYLDSDEFVEWLEANCPATDPEYPDPVSFALLNPDWRDFYDWRNPFGGNNLLFSYVASGDVVAGMEPDGTMENVEHKLRFVLRTGLNSVEAQTRLDLVRPGDFPHEGAGTYRGYTGGVSGRKAPQDWIIFCHLVDKLIEILQQIGAQANARCDIERKVPDCKVGTKYLNVTLRYAA